MRIRTKMTGVIGALGLLLTVSLAGECWAQAPGEATPGSNNTVVLTVSNKSVSVLSIGIGWNDSSSLDERWPEFLGPADCWSSARRTKHTFTKEEWQAFFDLMEWSGCHWLRHSAEIGDWEPTNDNEDPTNTNWKGFAFDSPQMQRHYTFLDQAEKRGIKVVFTGWRNGARWLNKEGGDHSNLPPNNDEEFGEAMAAVVYHLKRVKKYECIWALSLWNEPDGNGWYRDGFWPLYKTVDKHLRRLGVRENILLLGPDTTTGGNPGHILDMLKKHGPVVDLVADHDYGAFHGGAMDRSLGNYGAFMRGIEQAAGRKLPFVIAEFGNYGNGGGPVDDDKRVYDGALSTAEYLIRMVNAGAAGLARWEFIVYGNKWRNFGALTATDPKYFFRPYGPVYYPHAILARYVKPGWNVLDAKLESPRDLNGKVWAAALASGKGDVSVLLVNHADRPILLRFSLANSPPGGVLHNLYVVGPMPDGIKQGADVPAKTGGGEVVVPPAGITTLTTLDSGDLDLPRRVSAATPSTGSSK